MRKLFTVLSVIIYTVALFTTVLASQQSKFSKKFIKNMKKCRAYEENISSMYDNTKFTLNKKILGWQNGFCRYQETISSDKGSYFLECGFTDEQVEDLYKAMKAKTKEMTTYSLPLYEAKKNPKTGEISYSKSGTTLIKGDKAYILWTKLQNNPYFCKPTKLQ